MATHPCNWCLLAGTALNNTSKLDVTWPSAELSCCTVHTCDNLLCDLQLGVFNCIARSFTTVILLLMLPRSAFENVPNRLRCCFVPFIAWLCMLAWQRLIGPDSWQQSMTCLMITISHQHNMQSIDVTVWSLRQFWDVDTTSSWKVHSSYVI